MELVSLMYRYINKFINSDELLKELKKLDLSKFSKKKRNHWSIDFGCHKYKNTIPTNLTK